MKLKKEHWNEQDYQEYMEYLISLKEDKYKEFHQKLISTKYEILGIRVPIQRKIAKEIGKCNAVEFLSFCKERYYEEVNIEGLVIASLKEELREAYFDAFLRKIDNWAICDGFCSSLKLTDQKKEKYFTKIKQLLTNKEEFTVRVGLVLLLDYYVEEPYIKEIFSCVDSINRDEYYINMAIAWLLSECYIKQKEITLSYLKQNHLNKFTQNKTISKICDSYRVSKEEKQELKKLKIN